MDWLEAKLRKIGKESFEQDYDIYQAYGTGPSTAALTLLTLLSDAGVLKTRMVPVGDSALRRPFSTPVCKTKPYIVLVIANVSRRTVHLPPLSARTAKR